MANQAVKVELYGNNGDGRPRRFTIADATTIKKGDLMKLTDQRTAASAAETTSLAILAAAGIASMDKEANDGSTSISLWTDGIFELGCSGAVRKGETIGFLANNVVTSAQHLPAGSGAAIAGYALEDVAGNAFEVINVRINL